MLIPLSVMASVSFGLWMLTSKWLEDGQEPLADGQHEYAIVLGAKVKKGNIPSLSLHYRLEAAVTYANAQPHVKLVVTGGQGHDEDIAEALVMKEFLIDNGIAEERIIVEAKATSTYENLLYSKRLLPEDITAVTLITSDYHLKRTKILADKIGWKTDVVPAKTPDVVKEKVTLRERVALLKTFVMGK